MLIHFFPSVTYMLEDWELKNMHSINKQTPNKPGCLHLPEKPLLMLLVKYCTFNYFK